MKQEDLLKKLNAQGNDHSLTKEGATDPHYWYSFQDMKGLLGEVRKKASNISPNQ